MQSRASTQHDPMRSFRVEQVQETPDGLSTPLSVCVSDCKHDQGSEVWFVKGKIRSEVNVHYQAVEEITRQEAEIF